MGGGTGDGPPVEYLYGQVLIKDGANLIRPILNRGKTLTDPRIHGLPRIRIRHKTGVVGTG